MQLCFAVSCLSAHLYFPMVSMPMSVYLSNCLSPILDPVSVVMSLYSSMVVGLGGGVGERGKPDLPNDRQTPLTLPFFPNSFFILGHFWGREGRGGVRRHSTFVTGALAHSGIHFSLESFIIHLHSTDGLDRHLTDIYR